MVSECAFGCLDVVEVKNKEHRRKFQSFQNFQKIKGWKYHIFNNSSVSSLLFWKTKQIEEKQNSYFLDKRKDRKDTR